MNEPALLVVDASYAVGSARLVDGVDMQGRHGEVVAVIGPNGAGKSTVLRLICGDLIPTRGSVALHGVEARSRSVAELALIRSVLTDAEPQGIAFSSRAVVEMGRFPHRMAHHNTPDADHEAVSDAMARTATGHLADRVFATLSRGERARVSLARVIAQRTPIVVLDEPTAVLDVAGQEALLAQTRRLAADGKLVLMAVHDLNAAAHYADRIFLMHEGRMVAHGEPRDVLREEILETVYRQRMRVIDHPFRDCPLVLVDS